MREGYAQRRTAIDLAVLAVPGALLLFAAGAYIHYRYGYTLSGPTNAMGADDAYISFRYALNLWNGEGLVYNPGERVEGYSNLLFILLTLPAFLIGPDFAWPWSCLLNVAFAAGAIVLMHRHIDERHGPILAGLAALLLALHPLLWLWATSGMESSLILLLQVATWFLAVRRTQERAVNLWPLLAVAVLCVLTRADGVVTPVVAALYLACHGKRADALAVSGLAAATLIALTLWRLSYYGLPLPNTYYVKVYGDPLIRLLNGGWHLVGLVVRPAFGVFVLAGIAGIAVNLRAVIACRSLAAVRFEPLLAATLIAYYVYVGGDLMAERFLLVLIPLATAMALDWAHDDIAKALGTAGFLLAMQALPIVADARFHYTADKRDIRIELGRFLGERYPGALLATGAAGKIPFYSGLRTVDTLGLTDAKIARGPGVMAVRLMPGHGKYNPDYVLSRAPDLIVERLGAGFDLYFGITRAKWEAAGYRIKHLADLSAPGIVDTGNLPEAEIERLWLAGYRLAVLAR